MRAKIIDGTVEAWPYLDDQIRADNPNVSFPAVLAYLDLSAFNAVDVEQDAPPVTNWYERAISSEPEFIGGVWVSSWDIVPLTESEIDGMENGRWLDARAQRNAKLAACDWTQLPDAPVEAVAWAEYRQALRDITEQPNPFELAWPIEPK